TPIPLDQPVTLNSISGLVYTGSATHGVDEIWLRAFNGSWNGGWGQANITDAGGATASGAVQTTLISGRASVVVLANDDTATQGSVTIGAGQEVELASPYSGSVTFLAETGTLKLDQASSFAGTVSGFGGKDAIDLRDIAFAADMTLAFRANDADNGGILTAGGSPHTANPALVGQFMRPDRAPARRRPRAP